MKKIAKYKQISIQELENLVNESFNYSDLLRKLGYNAIGRTFNDLKDFLKLQQISTDHFQSRKRKYLCKYSFNEIFRKNSQISRTSVKRYILQNNLLPYVCEECNIEPFWKNKRLVLVLDHKNGINNDNRISNLRFLCPNCNSQTETFTSKNTKRYTDTTAESRQKYKELFVNEIKNKEFLLVKKLLKESSSLNQICSKLGISIKSLKKYCEKNNLDYSFLKNTKEISSKDKLIELLFEHRKLSSVGKILNISANAVKKKCKKYNIDYKYYYYLEHLLDPIYSFYYQCNSLHKTAQHFKTSTQNLRKLFKKNNKIILNPVTILTKKEILKVKKMLKLGYSNKEIYEKSDVGMSSIKKIKKELSLTKAS